MPYRNVLLERMQLGLKFLMRRLIYWDIRAHLMRCCSEMLGKFQDLNKA